jgi:hypothetical protein
LQREVRVKPEQIKQQGGPELVIEAPDVAGGRVGVLAAESIRPVDDAPEEYATPTPRASQARRNDSSIQSLSRRAVLARCGRDFERDDGALLGGGLRG